MKQDESLEPPELIVHRPDLEVVSSAPNWASTDPPLLFVHGTGHGAWCWSEHFLPYFAEKGFSSHAVSLRGHGKSYRPKRFRSTSIADYVEDVKVVSNSIDRLPVLIGHSLGGLVVLKYLEQYPAAGAVLLAPSPTEGMLLTGIKIQLRNPWLMTKVTMRRDYSVMYATRELVRKFLFSPDADMSKVEKYAALIGPESYRASLEAIYNLPRTSKINTKMLVLGAERDALLSLGTIQRTARALGAECMIMPGIAHEMMLEARWRLVADTIIEWLRTNRSFWKPRDVAGSEP